MNQEIKEQLNQAEIILSNVDENAGIEYATWTKDKAKIKFLKQMPNFAITNNYIYSKQLSSINGTISIAGSS